MANPRTRTLHLDRAALAVLAHPLRSRLLAELQVSGPATKAAFDAFSALPLMSIVKASQPHVRWQIQRG